MPGFIDVHSHLTLEPDENYYRKTLNELMRNPTEMAFYAGANARRTLEAGFTTVRHLGAREFIDVGLRNAIAANLTPGPRIRSEDRRAGKEGVSQGRYRCATHH